LIPPPRFAVAACEELWSRGRLVERRLSCGEATEDEHGIAASDKADPSLMQSCDEAIAAMRRLLEPDLRMRLVAESREDGTESTIVASIAQLSVVSDPQNLAADLRLLREIAAVAPSHRHPPPELPILWKNGTAAVLAHEAVGHPREQGRDAVPLPEWLTVDVALEPRRASFRDVPLMRMRHVRVVQHDAPFAPAPDRVEILLVDGGAYEPLTDTVTLRVSAADVVSGRGAERLAPFEIVETRSALLRAITGASGEPVRYPGVVCSREGQELFVESYAPLLLMEPR
jgi:hypothetical protein